MNCPSCGFVVPDSARFCPSCGHALQTRADERRVVTVLFADLCGFTGLSESRDPEQLKNLVDGAFERLAADVTSHGGRVDKIVGDALMALFGAPVAHEDDAERGVRAALQMHDSLAAYADRTGVDFRIRIGVNTGEVLVGALRAGGDYTAMGDGVNIANRLETTARPGQTLVGPDTYAATRDAISYEAVGAVQVRGREEPVQAWLALASSGLPGHRRRPSVAPLVGREAEVGMLRNVLEATVERSRPGLALIVGEPGMGTSRLADELASIGRSEFASVVLEGRCVPYGEANVWWPIAEIVRQLCRIAPDDSGLEASRKCQKAMAAAAGIREDDGEARRLADGLLYLLGFEVPADADPARARDDALRSLVIATESLASGRPVVIVLSDIHWADDLVLGALDTLLRDIRGLPILVVATARPELEERWTPAAGRHNFLVVHLDPLDEAASARLAANLLPDAPPDLRDIVVRQGGGNPLFLEELAALVSESTAYATTEHRELPATLRALVAARLDTLPSHERATLEDAAVVGSSGPAGALSALATSRGAREATDGLVARDLLVLDDVQWRFKSVVVRDVAYGTLTKAERARRHSVVGDWLADQTKRTEREDEHLEQIAHHYGAAAALVDELGPLDGVPDDIGTRALQILERAAVRMEWLGLHAAASHLLDHAFKLLPTDVAVPDRLLLTRARARVGQHELGGARADASAVVEAASRSGDREAEARGLTILGEVAEREGNYDESSATLERALSLWREIGDRAGEAGALRRWGMTMMFQGDLEAAQAAVAEAMEAYRAAGDARGEAWALQNLAWIAFAGGDLDAASDRLELSAKTFVDASDANGAGWAFGLLGWVRMGQGRLEEAAALAEGVIDGAQERGDRWGLGIMLTLLANIRLWRGRTSEAVERAREARRLFRAIGDRWGEAQSLTPLARGLVMSGSVEEGLAVLDEALLLARSVTDPIIRGMVGSAALAVALDIGEPERAPAEFGTAPLRSKRRTEYSFGTLLGLVQLQLGRVDDAVATLESAVDPEATAGESAVYLALAYAAAGRPLAAMRTSQMLRVKETTYRDRALGAVAEALAHLQQGTPNEADAALGRALLEVDATEDVLGQLVVRLARGHVLTAFGAVEGPRVLEGARRRLTELGLGAAGWERIFERSARSAGSAAAP